MADKRQIYLFCEAGMSTSIMVKKMQKIADEHNLPVQIDAYPMAVAQEKVDERKPIIIVLGPQVKFMMDKVKAQFEPQGIPVTSIDSSVYGSMNGEQALKNILQDLRDSKKEN